jgi:uncharacterized protein
METYSVIGKLLRSDLFRMNVLEKVRSLSLPDCWVAAGFVRNMVWDSLHDYSNSPLNDIDVIFYDSEDSEGLLESSAAESLKIMDSSVNWEVKNQAFMHFRNGDKPYRSSEHAMAFWPEKETAVGAKLDAHANLEIAAPFGLVTLLAGLITHNPKRDIATFNHRVHSKKWLAKWPRLKVVPQPQFAPDR